MVFQFLLVRLKESDGKKWRLFHNLISIPIGTIKSWIDEDGRGLFSEFQFLLVRLKVSDVNCELSMLRRFQFLLVRLKGAITGD